LVYSVDADTLTYLSYVTSPSFKGTKVVGPGLSVVSADGALVDIDSTSGKILSVLPFTGSRDASGRASFRSEGQTRIFSGHFLGVFDGDGKNLAPSGASEVRVDARSGGIAVH
jgi:hypothetical protein